MVRGEVVRAFWKHSYEVGFTRLGGGLATGGTRGGWRTRLVRVLAGGQAGVYLKRLAVQEITGDEVWLFIYEQRPGVVLYEWLGELVPLRREDHGTKMDVSGMVFFPRDAFKTWVSPN